MMESYYWQEQVIPCYHFQELGSTNQTAWTLLEQGYTPPFVVTADRQTAGKGQWGRQWTSGEGGLYLSLLLAPEMSIEQPSHLTITSVFGVTELLCCYQIPVQIKWLNDIFLQGKKLGGVLTETRIRNQQLKAIVIGIGVNWCNLVPEMGITLKDYLDQSKIPNHFKLSSLLEQQSFVSNLPAQLINLTDLKYIVLTGLLWGYSCYAQEGLSNILPRYEARLLRSSHEKG
ncbi:biotin/acetyl-CoA-carboxylase ligase [Halothece sp. PCC 7418]|uniref:biotin--[acetyl-CoA-carboxylase] ligase n=1 Tax=Halothece sp. (strain PCC 7418) TaxID=65093 RepID=UPI0002A074F6|nr:biotin--[acetyl-CoA-carboxylase] ligase [Halothece sp. PCC 7418]AFZ44836.1 biotin/acetyl-CoA-carboxylase ligase [Halothece sp. PCC 7418]